MHAVGVDVGGSGCRIAVVNVDTGTVQGDVLRLEHDLSTPAETILANGVHVSDLGRGLPWRRASGRPVRRD